jgi:hypothetical protein
MYRCKSSGIFLGIDSKQVRRQVVVVFRISSTSSIEYRVENNISGQWLCVSINSNTIQYTVSSTVLCNSEGRIGCSGEKEHASGTRRTRTQTDRRWWRALGLNELASLGNTLVRTRRSRFSIRANAITIPILLQLLLPQYTFHPPSNSDLIRNFKYKTTTATKLDCRYISPQVHRYGALTPTLKFTSPDTPAVPGLRSFNVTHSFDPS